ncbi:MAG: hypothetical protein IIT65_00250 [Lachnospiraceae bacterium]|nr:hypothetical protein [Lachnospiraceae bacterium]
MYKSQMRLKAFRFLQGFGTNMKAKFSNVCSKTGSYDVPLELFQKRTPRKNRALISWRAVKNNNLTLEQLDTFEGGVVVDFINNDFFDEDNYNDGLFQELKERLGSNKNVSSIISIKSESGSSSSAVQREAFSKLTNNTKINYLGNEICINADNYEQYAIKQNIGGRGQGNDTWSGFLFISIRGGQQDTIETHSGKELTLFNPACEYASADVCVDIDLVMSYYALASIDEKSLGWGSDKWREYKFLVQNLEKMLATIEYDNSGYKGNLLNYVKNQYSISLVPGQLTDPIQLIPITIDKFNISSRTEDSIDFTHEEAVIYEKYYWDSIKKCVLSPARPTNVFWSYHLSNMMQQNYNLEDYFKYEEERFEKRQALIKKSRES